MQLKDLFEAIGELEPGEQKPLENIQLRDLWRIKDRIEMLRKSINQSGDLRYRFQKDTQLQDSLHRLEDRLYKKIRMLTKAQGRPTASMMKMFTLLETECSEFLQSMQQAGKLLFRGTRDEDYQFEGRSRLDRRPKDSNPAISETFDQMLSELGVQALRSTSIYTTTSRSFATGYGYNLYMIFPKNGFNFLQTNKKDLILDDWHLLVDPDKLKDLYLELDAWGNANNPEWDKSVLHDAIESKQWKRVSALIRNNFSWEENSYGLPAQFDIRGREKDYVTSEWVQQEFKPNTTDLVNALRSDHEILINGEYWALMSDRWEQAIRMRYLNSAEESTPDIQF